MNNANTMINWKLICMYPHNWFQKLKVVYILFVEIPTNEAESLMISNFQ